MLWVLCWALHGLMGMYLNLLFALTMGGLLVDDATGEVQSTTGGKVPGLYAAGRTAVGICSTIMPYMLTGRYGTSPMLSWLRS